MLRRILPVNLAARGDSATTADKIAGARVFNVRFRDTYFAFIDIRTLFIGVISFNTCHSQLFWRKSEYFWTTKTIFTTVEYHAGSGKCSYC